MKLALIFLTFVLPLISTAQTPAPKLCMNQYSQPDANCDCKKTNSCFKAFDKSLNVQVQAAEKALGEGRGKKLYALVAPDLNNLDNVFNGTKRIEDYDIDKMKANLQKLDKVNNALILKAEMALKRKGVKNFRYADRVKLLNQTFENSLPQNVRDHIAKNGMTYDPFSDLVTGKQSFTMSKNMISENEQDNEPEESVVEEAKPSSDVASAVIEEDGDKDKGRFSDEELARARAKKFAINDINKDKSQNLFALISHRYQSVGTRVEFLKSRKSKENFRREEVLKDIFEIIDKM